MVASMKKDNKNKGAGNDYVKLDNSKKNEKLQKPNEDKLLEKKWKVFVKEAQKPQESTEEKVEKPVKKVKEMRKIAPKKSEVRELLETDVDKLYELTKDKGIVKVKDAAKILGINNDQVEEWARILEEHKLVRLRYPPVGEPVLILKRFTSDTEKIKGTKERKKLKPAKKVFIINLIILLSFAAFMSFYTIKFQTIRITYAQAYLAAGIIIIIGIVFVLMLIKKRGKNEGSSGEKGDKQA
jgi:hypothetical protein